MASDPSDGRRALIEVLVGPDPESQRLYHESATFKAWVHQTADWVTVQRGLMTHLAEAERIVLAERTNTARRASIYSVPVSSPSPLSLDLRTIITEVDATPPAGRTLMPPLIERR